METLYQPLTDNELLAVFSNVNGARALYVSENFVIQAANQDMLAFLNKGNDILGQMMTDVFPEVRNFGLISQSYPELLKDLWQTGEAVSFRNQPEQFIESGLSQLLYFDECFKPLRNLRGEIYSVLHTATDVTDRYLLGEALMKIEELRLGLERDSVTPAIEKVNGDEDTLLLLERQAITRKVEDSERDLRSLVMTAHFALVILRGPDWVVETVNAQMALIWNKSIEEITGKNLMDFLPELNDQRFPELLRKVYDSGVSYGNKEDLFFVETPQGRILKYISFYYDALFNISGEVCGIIVSAEDITETVQNRNIIQENFVNQASLVNTLCDLNHELAEANSRLTEINKQVYKSKETLRQTISDLALSEIRFRQLIQQAPVAICVLKGKDHVIESANELILNLWGKTGSVLNLPLIEALPELYDQQYINLLDTVFSTGIAFKGYEQKATLNYNGSLRDYYLDFIYQPLKNSEGETNSIMVVATDVTSQKLAGYEYKKAIELLGFSVKAADIGSWSIDLQTGSFTFSKRHKELFGFFEEDEVNPDQLVAQISIEFREASKNELDTCVQQGGYCDTTFSVIGFRDGKLRWIRALGGVIKDQSGKLSYFSGVSIETTQQKLDELRKNQFISIASHELKTPLTSMKGYIQLLKQKAEQSEDHFFATTLMKADNRIDKMTSIINSFLSVSQLESGKIQLIQELFVIEELIHEVAEEANVYGKEKKIKFLTSGITCIHADRNKIEQVISNLLSNAIKYSSTESTIEISCFADKNQVTVKIRNQGLEIPLKDQERIFERFFRVEREDHKNISGFGIGLYLCKEILDRHKGTLQVESLLKEGTTFIFSLPLI